MTLHDRIEVAPLSEERWDRIEGAVFAELDAPASSHPPVRRSRRAAAVAFGAASIAVAAAAAVMLTVFVDDELYPSMHVSRIVTGADATQAAVGDVTLGVAPQTAVSVVGTDAAGFVATLERGRVSFAVPPRDGRPAFVVHAADVRVEVVGTRFDVARLGDDVSVAVEEGVVRVMRGGRTIELRAGESWPAPRRRAERSVDDSPPSAAEHAAAQPEPAEETEGVVVRRAETARALFERAQELERASPERALGLYERAARRGGRWGANALYAQGRLELERGHRDVAARLLRRYLDRYSRGLNANDARELLARMEEAR